VAIFDDFKSLNDQIEFAFSSMEEQQKRNKCFDCTIDLCAELDAYYGDNLFAKQLCIKCRTGRGFK